MKTEVYTINKGVNRAIEFRGLQAQYIGWLAGGLIALLIVFAAMYIAGVNPFACVAIAVIGGAVLFRQVYRMSRKYGRWGWMKRSAARKLPRRIKAETRNIFL